MTRENACLTSTTQIGPKRNGSSVVDRWVDKTGKRATVIGDSVCRATVASEHANSPGVKDSDKTDCAVAVDRRGREKTGEHPAGICNGRQRAAVSSEDAPLCARVENSVKRDRSTAVNRRAS